MRAGILLPVLLFLKLIVTAWACVLVCVSVRVIIVSMLPAIISVFVPMTVPMTVPVSIYVSMLVAVYIFVARRKSSRGLGWCGLERVDRGAISRRGVLLHNLHGTVRDSCVPQDVGNEAEDVLLIGLSSSEHLTPHRLSPAFPEAEEPGP